MFLEILITLFVFKLYPLVELFNLFIILNFVNLILIGIDNCFSLSIIMFYILILDTKNMLNFYNNDKILLTILFSLSVIKINFLEKSFILDIMLFAAMLILLKKNNFKFNNMF